MFRLKGASDFLILYFFRFFNFIFFWYSSASRAATHGRDGDNNANFFLILYVFGPECQIVKNNSSFFTFIFFCYVRQSAGFCASYLGFTIFFDTQVSDFIVHLGPIFCHVFTFLTIERKVDLKNVLVHLSKASDLVVI